MDSVDLEYPDPLTSGWPDEVTDEMLTYVKQFGHSAADAHGAALLAATWLTLTRAGYPKAANAAYHAILLAMPPEVYIQTCKLRAQFGAWLKSQGSKQRNLARPVDEFEISVRVAGCFSRIGIKTVGDLVQKTAADLLQETNFGARSLKQVEWMLADMGLNLRPSPYLTQPVDKLKQPAQTLR